MHRLSETELASKDFEELQELALKIRQDAKEMRQKWAGQEPSSQLEAESTAVIEQLSIIIASLKQRLSETEEGSLAERDLSAEVSDCLGVKGGTYRDWGRYAEAAECYREGREYEEAVERLGGKPNSFCLVQHLVNLVLADPGAFCSGADRETRDKLVKARRVLLRQVGGARRTDPWAWADLALLSQLLDQDRVAGEWDEFDDIEPKSFVYASTAAAIRSIFQRLERYLDSGMRKVWSDVLERLE